MTNRFLKLSLPATAVALAAALVAALALSAAPANARAMKHCKRVEVHNSDPDGGSGAYKIRARNFTCRTARGVVRYYLIHGETPDDWALRTEIGSYLAYNGRKQVRFSLQG